jgi:hypothetical protein
MADGLVWAYGVVPGAQPPPGAAGLEGRPVESIPGDGLAVLASALPASGYTAQALQERLEDLDTLAGLARAHDAVLERAHAEGDVLPFRMCTIYASPDAVRAMLTAEGRRLASRLARLHGMAEWGVKAFAAPPAPASAQPRPASGAEYLAARRAARERTEADRDALSRAVADVHARLAERAAGAVLSRPHDRRLSGRREEMLLNGAYLVPRAEEEGFAAFVSGLAREPEADGLTLELTGPWPPYHFATEAAE